jgi:hypothetical protein
MSRITTNSHMVTVETRKLLIPGQINGVSTAAPHNRRPERVNSGGADDPPQQQHDPS